MKIPIEDQVAALEDAVSNHRSYVTTVKRLVAANERPKAILIETEARLPLMEAALKTLPPLNSATILRLPLLQIH